MTRNGRVLALLVALSLAAVVGVATAGGPNPLHTPRPADRPFAPSEVIFGDQRIPLRFFHDKHLAEEIDCTTCHERAEESLTSSDVLVPVGFEGEDVCTTCHDFEGGAEAEPPGSCATCHTSAYTPTFPDGVPAHESTRATNKPASIDIPVPNLKMNHKVHIEKGIECTRCHGEMKTIQVATRENALPRMNTCLECHDGRTAPAECRTCHLSKPDGRLVTHLATGDLMPAGRYRNDAHNDGWIANHHRAAKNDEAYCANCHEEKFCLACHGGVARPVTIHPNNWVITHPVSARRNMPSCSSCHRAQSFCTQCHKRMKVAPAQELRASFATQGYDNTRFVNFHPPGWVGKPGLGTNDTIREPNHHAFQAQRNIRTCAACHTERTCTACHSANTLNINPHPPRFGRSGKCKALRASNQRVCTRCHTVAPACL